MGLWDAFMGKSQREDISQANDLAQQRIVGGLTDYTNTSKEYLGKSLEFLQPGVESGNQTLKLLGDILGLNGQGAQASYFNSFQNDPGFMASQNAGIEAADRSAAARGLSRSGGQQRSLFDFGQRNMQSAFDSRVGSLFNLLGHGQNAAGTSAALTHNTGTGIADAQFGTGQLLANNATNFGNAMAQSRSIPINNILGLFQAAAGAVGGAAKMGAAGSDLRLKENVAKVGELYDGQPVYVFNYKGSNVPMLGLMAQDVEQSMPEAVTEMNGFKAVYYEKATAKSRAMGGRR